LSKKTDQLKKLFDEYTSQKNVVAQLEGNVQSATQRNTAHEENVRRLEQMVEALGDASTGLHGEQELRMAGNNNAVDQSCVSRPNRESMQNCNVRMID
jgi:hypothetical protein